MPLLAVLYYEMQNLLNANTERKLPISISIKYATKGYVIYLGLKKKTLKQK